MKRKIISDCLCDSCFCEEDTRHFLRGCPRSNHMWSGLGFNPSPLPATTPISSWFLSNLQSKAVVKAIPSSLIFLFGCHLLWSWRNSRLFDPGKPFEPIEKIISYASEYYFLGPQKIGIRRLNKITVYWTAPPVGSFKLNSDGAVKKDIRTAGSGGLIRDHLGTFIVGYARKIATTSSLTAEVWGLRDGLTIALEKNLIPLLVEVDASCILPLLVMDTPTHPLNALLHDCRCMISRLHVAAIDHVYREGNKAADALANLGCTISFDLSTFVVPPTGVDSCILNDANRVGSIRLCNLNSG